MRTIPAFLIVALLVTPAFAGMNPDVRLFLTGDSEDYVDQIPVPMPWTAPIHIYLVADGLDEGLTGVAMTLMINFPEYVAGPPVLLPGAYTIGDINDVDGYAIAWSPCAYPDPVTGFLVIADIAWSGGGSPAAGTAVLTAHPTETYKATDCSTVADQYCIFQNLGVGCEPPEGNCEVSPVEDSTWGSIKSLYR